MNELDRWIRKEVNRRSAIKLLGGTGGQIEAARIGEQVEALLQRARDLFDGIGIVGITHAIITKPNGDQGVYWGSNLVTDAGDLYYAQRGAAESPTNFTTPAHEYGTAGNSPAKGSDRSDLTSKTSGSLSQMEATYPKTNDPRGGTDVVSYKASWAAGTGTDTGIIQGILTNWAAGTPGASEPCLTHFTISSFDKGAGDTLDWYVHHTMNGV